MRVLPALLLAAALGAAPAKKPAATAARDAGASTTSADGGVRAEELALKHPVEINADRLEVQGKANQAVWTGNVKAIRETTQLSCRRLIAHYATAQEITRIECVGAVEVIDRDRRARGDRVDFDNVTGVLVVTGNPEAWQGKNHMRGTQVTFNLGSDTIEVENPRVEWETTPTGTPALLKGGKKK